MNTFHPIPPACKSEYRIIFTQAANQKKEGIEHLLRELYLTQTENSQAKISKFESVDDEVITTAYIMANIDVVRNLRTEIKRANLTDTFSKVEVITSVFKVRFNNIEQRKEFEILDNVNTPNTVSLNDDTPVLYFTDHNISNFHLTFHEMRKNNPEKWEKCEILVQENYLSWTAAELKEEKLNETARQEATPLAAKPRKL